MAISLLSCCDDRSVANKRDGRKHTEIRSATLMAFDLVVILMSALPIVTEASPALTWTNLSLTGHGKSAQNKP